MATGGKPPAKGPKPFLGEEDLFSELEAWDATFDALHDAPEQSGASLPAVPVMEWPAAAAADPTTVSKPAMPDPSHTLDDFDPTGLDDQLTLDGADEIPMPAGAARDLDAAPDPMETDFSDLGAEERPAALGNLLGRTTGQVPAIEDTARPEDAYPVDPDRTQIQDSRPVRRTVSPVTDDDDGVFTSASRPVPASRDPEITVEEDDELAPPPPPARPTPRAAEPVRSSPAIVRRVTAPRQAASPTRELAPITGASAFAEETRVLHNDELDAHRLEAAHEAARRGTTTSPPPIIDEDAYDDIEIEASASTAAPEPAEAAPAARRTAHVVRRDTAATRPPPPIVARDSSPVSEMLADDEPVARAPAGEDDFSDVAAAVGAEDELAIPADLAPPVRTSSPVPAPRAESLGIDFDEDPAPVGTNLDDVIGDLDDVPPPTLLSSPPVDVDRTMLAAPSTRDLERARGEDVDRTMLAAPSTRDLERSRDARARSPGRAPSPSADRPPADVADLYPRVKTPTSVPPLGSAAGLASGGALPKRTILDFGGGGTSTHPITRLQTPMPVAADREGAEVEPVLDLESVGRGWPEQVAPLPSSELDEASANALLVYEREVATLDDSATSAALRIEAGRLCERLSELDRARAHYDAALLADPRSTAALRGLRRIARASGDLGEVTSHLDTEIAVAGALERRPLAHYRIDLLMASGEQDLARVAVGEMLDSAPSDIRALLAQLELAFLDGRADEFGTALEQIANAVGDSELRAAAQTARGALAAHHNDVAGAASWFAAAAEADPSSLAARLGAVRQAAAQADGPNAAYALAELARQLGADPMTCAATAVRALHWAPPGSELASVSRTIALMAAADDPIVARLAAETAVPDDAAGSFAHWASVARGTGERAYAAARAAELDPARAAELWATALAADPGDDYGAAQLRTAHVAADATQAAIDVDLATSSDVERDRARLRAAYGMIALGQLDAAIDLLAQAHAARPGALAVAEALGEALAAAGKWSERAQLFADLAAARGEQMDLWLDPELAQLRSALAWEDAVGAASASEATTSDELQRLTAAALDAWERVLEPNPRNPAAHAAAIVLATRLGDREVLGEVLARAQAAADGTLAGASLAFRRARLVADDAPRAESLVRDLQPLDDPRRTVAQLLLAARTGELGDAASALEERAGRVRGADPEMAALRLRAAQLALDAGDAPRATRLLQQVEQALPGLGVVPDLLAAARRRAGDRPTAGQVRRTDAGASSADAFARLVRDADLAVGQGDAAGALALYQRALELRKGDPLASVPLVRLATELREPAPVTALALEQLRIAEDNADGIAKATAYELLAFIDAELRGDAGAAQIALESAAQADPTRIDLMHRLEQVYAANDELPELVRLRRAELDQLDPELVRDRAALQLDLAGLAERDRRPELELADLYRAVLETAPKARLALLHLESIVRGGGASEELARLEEQIAAYFEGDARAQAAFWTRAGETLGELGQIDAAVQRFGRAEAALPGHVPALEGWRHAALKGALWIDVAEAANRQATGTSDLDLRAALHHFAGVALMDKALIGEQAMVAFRRALEANPSHKDAFLRLRILLEEDANHDDLATLLAQRLDVESEPRARIELHRALAELHRNFLSDRETAKQHYRAILEDDGNDLRSHAAIADIAWEQGQWQEAADALMARARLEREPEVLKTLCFRLGLIYADRLVDVPMALKAFQRALTYQPDDEATLVRLADLAAQIGEWKLALGACERLVKNEGDPDRRVAHLHRVARIFKAGFGDTKRAERALTLAVDSSPTNDDALKELVQFYREAGDITSARVHLNRVAGTMRNRIAGNPLDGVPYRVISRAMVARESSNVPGSLAIARAAAELAELLGASGEPEQRVLAQPARPDVAHLIRPDADELVFPRGVQPELRQIFQLLGDRIAKHVGVNVQAYGVSRGDRVRAKDSPVAAVAQTVATGLGFGELDVYISSRQPWAMIAEPTSPVSLVLGSAISSAGGDAIRFAAGGALKLAQASLAIPARLPTDELGVLVVALLRLFQPEFPGRNIDADAVAAQFQKLRRLVPTNLLNELRPYALAIDAQRFDHQALARDLKAAAVRAGLVASGSVLAGLRVLAAQAEAELPGFLASPVAQDLVSFALGEDHAAIAK